MNKILIANNKTLKLTNVLICNFNIKEDNIAATVTKMENYIKSKGAMPIGPLIQKSKIGINDEGEPEMNICLMRQANNFIHSVESPYKMESLIRISNCVYARYTGPEESISLAYQKIDITAFEEGFNVCDANYTIFVDKQDDDIVADIFVEKKTNE